MSVENTLARIERSLDGLSRKKRDWWDKTHINLSILLPASVAFAGHQYAVKMKEAEIHSNELQHNDRVRIENRNLNIDEADILSKFIPELLHADSKRREIAIKGIMIAMGPKGSAIVSLFAEQPVSTGDTSSIPTQTQSIARSVLDERRSSLVAGLVSKRGGERTAAYEELTSRKASWHTDQNVVEELIRAGRTNLENKLSIYHVIITLRDISRLVSQPREAEIIALCDEAVAKHSSLHDEVFSLKAWLKTSRTR